VRDIELFSLVRDILDGLAVGAAVTSSWNIVERPRVFPFEGFVK
jgi:hypothetical protein